MDSNMVDDTESDHKKFAYHEGARIIRTVQDRICEFTYTGTVPSQDERETLCDMLIELHQLLYGVTLHTVRLDGLYEDDEIYSDGRPVVSRTQLPVDPTDYPIPAEAYRGDIGEDIPIGGVIYVWRPGDSDHTVLTGDEAAAVREHGAHGAVWKGCADLRASGLLEWVRGDNGRIVKRPGPNGRPSAVSAITAAGVAECARLQEILEHSPVDDATRISSAVTACIDLVREKGAAIFPDLNNHCAKIGIETLGIESMVMGDRPHVVWWGGASESFLDVIDAMLAQEPRIRMIRTSADCYRKRSIVVTFHGAEMPVVEGEIAAEGYDSQHWAPIIFVWDESCSAKGAEVPASATERLGANSETS
jgi:hypothetical protein